VTASGRHWHSFVTAVNAPETAAASILQVMTIEADQSRAQVFSYRPIHTLIEAVASATDLTGIYEAALIALRDGIGVEKSSILLFDADRVMRFKAWLNLSAEYRTAVEGHTPWTPDTQDAQPVLVEDVRDDASLASLQETILDEGIQSLAFIPLVADRRLLGKFMLYYGAPHNFSDDEMLFAKMAASQVAFAIDQQFARTRIQESGRLYRDLVEGLGQAVYTTDAEGRILLYNEAAAELWGRRPKINEDLWCDSWRVFYPDGSPMPLEECPMAKALRLNRPIRGEEIWVERPDGRRVWVAPFPTPLRDEAGTLVGAVNVLVDVTSRKEAEQEIKLRREEAEAQSQHLAAMLDSAVAGIAEVTGDGHLIAVNDRYCEMVGRTREELLGGMTCIEITHPDDQEMARDALRTLVDEESSSILEKRYVRPDGEIVWVHKSISAIRSDGLLKSVVAIVTDVTERKRVEDELRTASALKDQFLGLVSHELRTPTSTVVANALLLLRRGDQLTDEDRQQALEDIAGEGTKLQRVIENLLLLTRLDVAGEPVAEQVALKKMVAERVEVFLRRRPGRTVSLGFDDALPTIHGQEALLAMVMDNLLSNADKYSPADANIEVAASAGPDGMVELRVSDRGIGVDPAELPQLFTPFFRTTIARGYASGMGLGLAVCKRILDAYGGTIRAEGRSEGGTDFILALRTVAPSPGTIGEP